MHLRIYSIHPFHKCAEEFERTAVFVSTFSRRHFLCTLSLTFVNYYVSYDTKKQRDNLKNIKHTCSFQIKFNVLFTRNEFWPVTDITTDIIYYWRIKFRCKFLRPFSLKLYSQIQNSIGNNLWAKFPLLVNKALSPEWIFETKRNLEPNRMASPWI